MNVSEKLPPLWLHAYSGRENGLMIVGTPSTFKVLAHRLLAATQDAYVANAMANTFPPEVAMPEIIGPYKDVPDFALSFHLQGSAALERVVPLRRRDLGASLFLVIAICAVTGAVTIAHWVASFF